LPQKLREFTKQALEQINETGEFDRPLLWYYSPMDSAWSLGYFENRGVVYDCMDELSQFTGAPKALVQNEARLIEHADVVFTGGYELGDKKRKQHDNVHTFGCGVEFDHFNLAADPTTQVPPDIDFMQKPVIGWFGVVDERVDYAMVGEMARMRPDWFSSTTTAPWTVGRTRSSARTALPLLSISRTRTTSWLLSLEVGTRPSVRGKIWPSANPTRTVRFLPEASSRTMAAGQWRS